MLLTKFVQLCTMPVHLPGIIILYITNSVSQKGKISYDDEQSKTLQ